MFPFIPANSLASCIPPDSGNQNGLFAFGYNGSSKVSISNLVSTVGVVSADVANVGIGGRKAGMACEYGGDKGIFGHGYVDHTLGTAVATTHLVANCGVIASETTGVGTPRSYPAACGYGGDKGLFGYGNTDFGNPPHTSLTNKISNAGVVASDVTGVGTARGSLAATEYGGDKGIFGDGYSTTFSSMTNKVSNTGVVASDTTGVGTPRWGLAACGYGTDKGIFGFGAIEGWGYCSTTNLVSNTGVVASDTTGVGSARNSVTACEYSTDKGIFGFGTPPRTSVTNLISNTGVAASDTTGVGTARDGAMACSFG